MNFANSLFHPCPPETNCPNCSALSTAADSSAFDWSFLDGVYCISLQSRDDRMASAAGEFHRVGLCKHVEFYRPAKHPTSPKKGIWESHRAVAQQARAQGQSRVLIFEDDVVFSRLLNPRTVLAIRKALQQLPPEWKGFYLGHWPLSAQFLNWKTFRTISYCAHAYIASDRLIDWLCEHPYSKKIPRVVIGGKGIDAAFAALSEMYALFPMIALQSGSPGDHKAPNPRRRKLRDYVLNTRFRDPLLANLLRPNEMIVVAMSPLFSLYAATRHLLARLVGGGG